MKRDDAIRVLRAIRDERVAKGLRPYIPVVSLRQHGVDSQTEARLVAKGTLVDAIGAYKLVD